MRKIIMVLLSCMILAGSATAGMAIVQINEANFPDATLRSYITTNFDTNGDKILSNNEILAAKKLSDGSGLSSLEGIKYLTSLQELDVYNTNLTRLDLSGMASLTDVRVSTFKALGDVDISGCTALSKLQFSGIGITSLNLTGCESLRYLYCSGNKLTSLSLKDCASLEQLDCYNNAITELDLSSCPKITNLNCYNNKLTSLNVKNCPKLTKLYAYNNLLPALDVSGNEELTELNCSINRITKLDVSKNTKLTRFYCNNNRLTMLDFENNANIGRFYNYYYTCSPQNIDGLTVTQSNGKYIVSLRDYLSTNVKNIVGGSVYGKDSEGNLIEPAYDSGTWVLTFDVSPASVYYDYDTKFEKDESLRYMGVTIAANASPIITTASLPNATVDVPYAFELEANGEQPITWTVDGYIPEGLTFDGGKISGTPVTVGVFTFTVTAANDFGSEAREFMLTISSGIILPDPVIPTETLPDAIVGNEYAVSIFDAGSYTDYVAEGLPEGLTLDSGTISGVPTVSGTFTITVTLTIYGVNETRLYSITVNDSELTAYETTRWEIVGGLLNVEYYNTTIYFESENDGHSFTIGGALPANLTIHLPPNWELDVDDGAKISVSDASKVKQAYEVDGLESPAVKIIGANDITLNESGIIMTAWVVDEVDPVIANETTKWNREGGKLIVETTNRDHYEFEPLDGTNGDGFIINGNLPEGLVINLLEKWGIDIDTSYNVTVSDTGKIIPASEIPGLPSTAHRILGPNTITLNASEITMTAFLFTEPTITTASNLGTFKAGNNISLRLKAEGTEWKMSWSAENLPEGLNINSDGLISGAVSTANVYTFTAIATNPAGTNRKTFTLTIRANNPSTKAPTISTKKLPEGYNHEEYSFRLEADDADEWRIKSGNLPDGLELDPNTGEIYGEINTSKITTYKFSVEAANDYGTSRAKSLSIKVNSKAPGFKTEALKSAKCGTKYDFTIKTQNFKPTTWSITGDLPEGVTFSKGKLSGKPKTAGEYEFTVFAGNGAVEIYRDFELVVNVIPPKLKGKFKTGKEGTPYTCTLQATGTTPIEWDFYTLPDELYYTLDATGETCTITGTPLRPLNDNILVRLTNGDGEGDEVTKSLKLKISVVKPAFNKKVKPYAGYVDEDYYFEFELSKKPGEIEWDYTGSLPDGLEFDNGIIDGTPTESGTFRFTVTALNANTRDKATFSTSVRINPSRSGLPETNGGNPESGNGISYYDRMSLTAEMLARAANSGEIIAAVLPAIEVSEENTYDFTVSLDQSIPEGSVLVWHSYPDGEYDENDPDNVIFLDDNDKPIERVPETHSITVEAWLVPGKVYEPIITVKISR